MSLNLLESDLCPQDETRGFKENTKTFPAVRPLDSGYDFRTIPGLSPSRVDCDVQNTNFNLDESRFFCLSNTLNILKEWSVCFELSSDSIVLYFSQG